MADSFLLKDLIELLILVILIMIIKLYLDIWQQVLVEGGALALGLHFLHL